MEKDILQYHRYGGSRGRSWNGCQQKAISAKLDNNISDMVDSESRTSGVSRNALINMSLKWYLEELDKARLSSTTEEPDMEYILKLDLTHLTCQELEELGFISRSTGSTMEAIALTALKVMLRDYNKAPMRWMP